MKKVLIILFILLSVNLFSQSKISVSKNGNWAVSKRGNLLVNTTASAPASSNIIADHSIVADYVNIPQQYIDSVKKRWVSVVGASHGLAYAEGCALLEAADNKYQIQQQFDGTPAGYTASYLRINEGVWENYATADAWTWYNGRQDFWTNATILETRKSSLQYCKDNGPALYAMLYGWSFDPTMTNAPGGTSDPVYGVRWAGSTTNGADGDLIWGLDDGDEALTSNSVSMLTYIRAMQALMDYCTANSITTKIIWSTGPVDGEQSWNINESGYQQYLKWEYIRNHVDSLSNQYFIDYADILSYNDAGEAATTTWEDNNSVVKTFPVIHSDNMGGDAIGHIGSVGALRLGKAMWWLLARMAGWDGN